MHALLGRDRAAQSNANLERTRGVMRRCAPALILLPTLVSVAPAAADDGGGAPLAPRPVLTSVSCRKACDDLDVATEGSTLRVDGRHLETARSVLFLGGKGSRDDVRARVSNPTASHADVKVPAGARTGKLTLTTADGQISKATTRAVKIAKLEGQAAPKLAAASPNLSARVTSSKVYFYGRRRATLQYLIKGSATQDVRVDLVRRSDARSIAHWISWGVTPGELQTVTWNGKSGSVVPRAGRYQFRIAVGPQPHTTASRNRVQSSSTVDPPPASASPAGSFSFLPYVFPIRGPHQYGMGAGRFGAGRAGHTHQGQDVFAKCGTPLVAARGGRVRWKAWHSAAGNYVVIDGAGTGVDTVYMHLKHPSMLSKGQKVYTGQLLGYVGDTGDAVGCHLHFEMWSSPGWYEGGAPFDPLGYLKAWDKVS